MTDGIAVRGSTGWGETALLKLDRGYGGSLDVVVRKPAASALDCDQVMHVSLSADALAEVIAWLDALREGE